MYASPTRNARAHRCSLGILLVLGLLPAPLSPARADPIDEAPLDEGAREAIIEQIATTFLEDYADLTIAERAVRGLRARQARGDYAEETDLVAFTHRLTEELQVLCDDLHIRILPYEELPAYRFEDRLPGSPHDNYGFRRVEIRPADIGYFEWTGFFHIDGARAAATATVEFLQNCRALIIDLRSNQGGDTTVGEFVAAHLFEERQHLTTYYTRNGDETTEVWTAELPTTPRLTEMPVYILTSSISFSASEGFAYQLQALGRAIIVGEKTRGGGNAVTYRSYPEVGINIRVPNTAEINPVTGESFQSKGVVPDIACPSRDALLTANIAAIDTLLRSEEDPALRHELDWARAEYEARLHPVALEARELEAYVGSYGIRRIERRCDALLYQRGDAPPRQLVPLGDDRFSVELAEQHAHFRLIFVRDDAGAVSGLYLNDVDNEPTEVVSRSGQP